MSMLLLRGVTQMCKAGSTARLSSNFAPASGFSLTSLFQASEKSHTPQFKPSSIKLTPAIREFSVSRAVCAPAPLPDHSKLWTIERIVSAGMVVALPLGVMFPNILFDLIMAVSITMHTHWGLEAIVVDYLRPSVVGAGIAKAGHTAVYGLSIFILVGLLHLIVLNAGLGNTIKLFYKL